MISFPILVYIFVFFLMGCFIPFNKIKLNVNKTEYIFAILIIFAILLFVFDGEKSDWHTYRGVVDKYTNLGSTYFEKGFDFLLFVANRTIGFQLIPFFTCFLFIYTSIKVYKLDLFDNCSEYYIFIISFFLGFLPFYFGALRQAISSCFIIIVICNLTKKKNYFSTICCVIVSVLFHNSAILIYALYFLIKLFHKITKKTFPIMAIIFTLLCFVFFKTGIGALFELLDQSNRLGKADMFQDGSGMKDLFIALERIILLVCSFTLLRLYGDKPIVKNICLLDIVGSLFFLALFKYARNVAGRTLGFFRYFDVFVLYYFIKLFFSKNKRDIMNGKIHDISIIGTIMYSFIRYYVTVASSGVF